MSIQSNTKLGTVLQISRLAERFPGCLMIVDQVRSWGVRGYLTTPEGAVYIRVAWDDVAYVGEAVWVWDNDNEQTS